MAIELPEAFIISNQLDRVIKRKVVTRIHISNECTSLINQGFIRVEPHSLDGIAIINTTSKGKWLFIQFIGGRYLLLALETGGKILFHESLEAAPSKYHLWLEFEDGSALTIWMVGWGFAKVVHEDCLEADRYPGKLGLSPIDEKSFTLEAFNQILSSRKDTIKSVLLDQWTIAGIGNGYAQDILFRAKIHPKRKASDLLGPEKFTLYHTIISTLQNAIQMGGSESEADLFGHPGSYKKVFGGRKKTLNCPVCGARIEKLVLGSSTYFCPTCQK
jgi:formamidopyrimidine-DNA glycosylase